MTSSRLGGAARAGALSVLEECAETLAVYRCTLKNLEPEARDAPSAGLAGADIDAPAGPHRRRPEASSMYGADDRIAFEMGHQEVIFEKLNQDSAWLEELICSSKRSLLEDGDLEVLIEEVAGKMTERSREEELLARARRTGEELKRRQREIAEERKRRIDEEERLRAELLRLRNDKERLQVKTAAESRFTRAWLDSRREQQALRSQISREQLSAALRRCQLRETNEHLVTRNVEAFLRLSIEKSEKEAREWAERRQAETKSYEKEIHRLRVEIEKKRAALEELQEEYRQRQEFIDSCLAEKEAARRQRELEEHVRRCAVRIQAWWRGLMVRCKLGPYRPEEKKRKRPAKLKK